MDKECESSIKPQDVPVCLHPIVQPAYVNQMPALCTPIHTVPVVPQPNQYVTVIEPVFIDHISRHNGEQMVVMTTAGKVEGVLTGVATDHIQLNIGNDRAIHLRIDQIVYFEGFPISYRP
ncbi:DUF2642 domain-containing protein [Heliobacillus mobilis]|uniref:DUF2642 domain-containing protein n=1 Tax=Heliobacterium mobile TaxID=28064 RepID=A0A6I3SL59_HELMO|nr:DUF2642 domain-containing protein [Heliobacterium mobile]MTV49227.1 DUF2642 domain-containing protein [Heliobacterium mobile]